MSEPLLLSRRHAPGLSGPEPLLVLALGAAERQRLRGHHRSVCGRDLLLQLPRDSGPLQPEERLGGDDGQPLVRVEAASEPLLLVRAEDPLQLLQAAYHLGNRHVALEVRQQELRLLEDPVLADLLVRRGLRLERLEAPFLPEPGAYAEGHGHQHSHHPHGPHAHDHGDQGVGLVHQHGPGEHGAHPQGPRGAGDLAPAPALRNPRPR